MLAARLSENRKCKVRLLESSGADTDPAIPAPHGSFALQSEAFNWSDLTVPQEHLDGRRVMVSADMFSVAVQSTSSPVPGVPSTTTAGSSGV